MEKRIALSFLIVFLCVNTELQQLLKLPVLIHHFFEHHHQPEGSFAHFLADHYSEKQKPSDPDNHEHSHLPFKTNDCAMASVSIALVNQIQYAVPSLNPFQEKAPLIWAGVIYSSTFLSNIWQPPKSC